MIVQRKDRLTIVAELGGFDHATTQPSGHLELKSLPRPHPCIRFLLQFEIFGSFPSAYRRLLRIDWLPWFLVREGWTPGAKPTALV